MSWFRTAGILMVVAALVAPSSHAQQSRAFGPLVAAPLEPSFFVGYLWADSPRLAQRLGVVGLGHTFGLMHSGRWTLGIGGGVFSQFNMTEISRDLVNTDYVIGVPVSYSDGAFAARFRLYHQSSHLGDEYMLRTLNQRIHVGFEATELLAAHDGAAWRLYGGGVYVLARPQADFSRGAVRAGVEYRGPEPFIHLARRAAATVVAGIDVAVGDFRGPAWSLVGGVELGPADPGSRSGPRLGLLLRAYTGPAPFGQFFRDRLSYLGLGVSFAR